MRTCGCGCQTCVKCGEILQNLSVHAMGMVRVSRHFGPRTLRTQDISVRPKCLSALVPNCPGQIFQIGTVRYTEGLWRMRRHWPVIAHCTDSEDFSCPEIWALVPKCLMNTSAKCLTDTSAPRKTLWHWATLDQAMATVDGCANITVCENKFSINLRNVSIYTTYGLWNQYRLKIWFCKVQNSVSDRYWYQT